MKHPGPTTSRVAAPLHDSLLPVAAKSRILLACKLLGVKKSKTKLLPQCTYMAKKSLE